MGKGFKPVDVVYDSLSDLKGGDWVFMFNVLNDAYELVDASVVQRIRITTEKAG